MQKPTVKVSWDKKVYSIHIMMHDHRGSCLPELSVTTITIVLLVHTISQSLFQSTSIRTVLYASRTNNFLCGILFRNSASSRNTTTWRWKGPRIRREAAKRGKKCSLGDCKYFNPMSFHELRCSFLFSFDSIKSGGTSVPLELNVWAHLSVGAFEAQESLMLSLF